MSIRQISIRKLITAGQPAAHGFIRHQKEVITILRGVGDKGLGHKKTGLINLLYKNHADFLDAFPDGPAVPIPLLEEDYPEEEPPANAAPSEHTRWNRLAEKHDVKYSAQQEFRTEFRRAFLDSIDPIMFAAIDTDNGLSTYSIAELYEQVCIQAGTINRGTRRRMKEEFSKPYDSTADFSAHIMQLQLKFNTAEKFGFGPTDYEKNDYLIESIEKDATWSEYIKMYDQEFQHFNLATWAETVTQFLRYDAIRVATVTTATLGFAASAREVQLTADLERALATIQQHNTAAAVQSAAVPNAAGSGGPATKPKPYYCWTHGPNRTHDSNACNNKATGHQNTATLANKMSGKEKLWFPRTQGQNAK